MQVPRVDTDSKYIHKTHIKNDKDFIYSTIVNLPLGPQQVTRTQRKKAHNQITIEVEQYGTFVTGLLMILHASQTFIVHSFASMGCNI